MTGILLPYGSRKCAALVAKQGVKQPVAQQTGTRRR